MALNASNTQTPEQAPDEAPDSAIAEDTTATQEQPSSGVDLQPAKKELDIEESEGKSQTWRDDKRNAIFAKAKAKREESVIPFEGNNNDPNVLYGSTSDQSELSDLEREAMERAKQVRQREIDAATGKQQPQQDQQQTQQPRARRLADMEPEFSRQRVTIVVDGQEREATIEELVRSAQMNGAADKRLTAAEEVLRRAQELRHAAENQRRDAGTQEHQQQDQGQQAEQERDTSAPDFRKLAEKIQLGTADEAAEAMEQFAQATRSRAPASQPQGEDDSMRLRRVLEEQASEEAIVKFGNENPDVAQDAMFQSVVANFTHRAMIDDLARAGVPQDTLRAIVQDANTLTDTHKKARAMRIPGIRGTGELLQAGLAGAREWRSGQKGSQPGAQNQRPSVLPAASQPPTREERRAAIQTQPAARRNHQPQAQAAVSQEQNRSRSVAEIRKARGQPA